MKISVRPALLRWARERASLAPDELAKKLGLVVQRVHDWEQTGELTLNHLQRLAEKTHTPVGFLFLSEPPLLDLPIADYRSHSGGTPSPDLLETVYHCEQRQAWYRQHATMAEDRLAFVGSAEPSAAVDTIADDVRQTIGLDTEERARFATWEEALRDLFAKVEAAGILIMRNGIVGNNTHRPLSVTEFRGFALSDPFAPLVFVNAADSKSAQMFTVIHELVHLWRGESGVSDVSPSAEVPIERYCNQVAAEVLVPRDDFAQAWQHTADNLSEIRRLARRFKVSSLVVLIRAKESGAIGNSEFEELYRSEMEAAEQASKTEGGGDFYRTQRSRLGGRFASAVIASTLEGGTSYTEAFGLLGIRKLETFNELARKLGVLP
jgi:Zn-dependent peptidase ImmA (M78 family)